MSQEINNIATILKDDYVVIPWGKGEHYSTIHTNGEKRRSISFMKQPLIEIEVGAIVKYMTRLYIVEETKYTIQTDMTSSVKSLESCLLLQIWRIRTHTRLRSLHLGS